VGSADDSLSAVREALVDELNKSGITAKSTTNSLMPAGVVVILVGVKPNPLEEKRVQEAMEAVARHPEIRVMQSGNWFNVP
jgi:ABC-type sugar transport system substrate-binding protein